MTQQQAKQVGDSLNECIKLLNHRFTVLFAFCFFPAVPSSVSCMKEYAN